MQQHREGLGLWDDWLNSSLNHLRKAQLLRTLRPTVWCNSSTEALIHRADLDAWVAGQPPVVRHYDHCGGLIGAAASVAAAAATTGPTVSNRTQPVVRSYDDSSLHVDDAQQGTCGSCSGGRCNRGGNITNYCTAGTGVASSKAEASSSTASDLDLVRLRLFSLNDYLGLASHPEVSAAAARAANQVGLGPRSSALVAGYTHSHRQLEEGLAGLKGTEDCLLFPTGFAANLAVMTSLAFASPAPYSASAAGPYSTTTATAAAAAATAANARAATGGSGLAVFSDELNHASIIDGARLATRSGSSTGSSSGGSSGLLGAGATQLHIYRHNDLGHLEELLAATPPGVRRLVVTDSLFSMDGDFADLRGLIALKRRQPFLLAVDEAHATLVCGEGGGGAAEAAGVADQVDLHVGTLSKAFGCLGGFVACSTAFKQLLLNRGRAFVYSTSLPVPVVEAAAAAMRVSARETWRRAHVWSLVRRLGDELGVPALSPIVPLVVGPEGPTLELSSRLLAAGLHVPAIRPPTVPAGTCRLRVSLSAAHSYDDVDELVRLVRESSVPLVRLPHLLDPRAALPQSPAAGPFDFSIAAGQRSRL